MRRDILGLALLVTGSYLSEAQHVAPARDPGTFTVTMGVADQCQVDSDGCVSTYYVSSYVVYMLHCWFDFNGAGTIYRHIWNVGKVPSDSCDEFKLDASNGVRYTDLSGCGVTFPESLTVTNGMTFKFYGRNIFNNDYKAFKLCPFSVPTPPGIAVTSGSSVCSVDANGCISDGSGNYGNYESCEFTVNGPGQINREQWDLEYSGTCAWDYIQLIGGGKYCGPTNKGTEFPATMTVSGSTELKFKFYTDGSVTKSGFKLCFVENHETTETVGTQTNLLPCCKGRSTFNSHWHTACFSWDDYEDYSYEEEDDYDHLSWTDLCLENTLCHYINGETVCGQEACSECGRCRDC